MNTSGQRILVIANHTCPCDTHVGDTNPLLAIEDALAHYAATEIVIATHPPGRSHWLERGLIEKARARFDVPVIHVVSRLGVEEAAAAIAA